DLAAYDACMTDGSKQSAVKAETDQTQQLGIDSTPTLYVNGVRNTGALGYDQLAQLIRAAAANPSPAASPSP
ncbi:MAG TPA: thioredoxin domain-containing protein, partial [Candidatus Limnocylindrales bacterium]